MSIASRLRGRLTPEAGKIAPGPAAAVMARALDRAVRGVGPLRGAAASAERQLSRTEGSDGDRLAEAAKRLVSSHVRLAATEGFVTNIGGLVTMAATIPANVAGLALLQCRMVAAIAHLRGYDLDDHRVREAVLVCILGSDDVNRLVKRGKLPGTPRQLADGSRRVSAGAVGEGSGQLSTVVSAQVVTALVGRVVGRRAATSLGKRLPLVGGAVGAGSDGLATWRVGRYAAREFARPGS